MQRRGSKKLVNALVLVVSHPQLRKLVGKVLLRDGFIVLEAHDAASALAVVESLAGAIALVMTDDELPDMDGSDLTSYLLNICHRLCRITLPCKSKKSKLQSRADCSVLRMHLPRL